MSDADAPDGTVTIDDFAVYGAKTPSSNEVANAISGLDETEPERYIVRWSGETMDYGSTYYRIERIGYGRGGRPMLEIEGGRGGRYEIDSNPMGKPKIRYLPPNDSPQEERLTSLTVYDTQFKWTNWIKRRLGL